MRRKRRYGAGQIPRLPCQRSDHPVPWHFPWSSKITKDTCSISIHKLISYGVFPAAGRGETLQVISASLLWAKEGGNQLIEELMKLLKRLPQGKTYVRIEAKTFEVLEGHCCVFGNIGTHGTTLEVRIRTPSASLRGETQEWHPGPSGRN